MGDQRTDEQGGHPGRGSNADRVPPQPRYDSYGGGPRRAENTDEPSLNAVSLARRTASLMSATVLTTTTGPNVSCTAEQSSGT